MARWPEVKCRGCGVRVGSYRRIAYCPNCFRVVQAARACIRQLILEEYVEDLGGGAFLFRQGAQELADLLGDEAGLPPVAALPPAVAAD